MRLRIFLCQPNDVLLTTIRELAFCAFERNPKRLFDFDPHIRRDFSNFARFVSQQIEADNLENTLLVAPRTDVHIFNVRELDQNGCADSSLLAHFADGGLLRFLAGINQPLGQCEYLLVTFFVTSAAGRLPLRLDYRQFPALRRWPHHHSSGGDLSQHRPKLTGTKGFVTGLKHRAYGNVPSEPT